MKRFGFFNSINGDRKYLASDISEALDIATTTGIKQEEGVFEVTPHEDMTVKINPGSALIFGCFYSNDEDELIKLDMADGELNRIDRIVIRYDRFDRSVDTVVLKGTNALNPTPPTPLRNENQFDLVLADIYIRKAATEILTSDITDMRESELCGYIGVKGAVSQIEFDAHLADYAKLGSQVISAARDVNLEGVQRISTINKPKAILIYAVHGGTRLSIGSWSENGTTYCAITNLGESVVGSVSAYGNIYVHQQNSGIVGFAGTIKNITETGFDIDWSISNTTLYNLSGTVSLRIQVWYG